MSSPADSATSDVAAVPTAPAARQFALQAGAALLVACLSAPYLLWRGMPGNGAGFALATGFLAGGLARLTRQPVWWQLIHAVFAPLLWLGLTWQQGLGLSPHWFLGLFLFVWLLFRGAATGRIPLYFSGPASVDRLAAALPAGATLLDVGAGIGSLLLPLAQRRPDLRLAGIEHAPLPWLIGKWRTRACPKLDWRWGDFWQHHFAAYSALYCFLSPAPMLRLWQKACREMHPGSLFISQAFPVPGQAPERILEDAASRRTLFFYRIPE
jgi:hypothetical protein